MFLALLNLVVKYSNGIMTPDFHNYLQQILKMTIDSYAKVFDTTHMEKNVKHINNQLELFINSMKPTIKGPDDL